MFQSQIHCHYPCLHHMPHHQKSRHGPLKVLNTMEMIAPQWTKPSSVLELQERCMNMFIYVSVSIKQCFTVSKWVSQWISNTVTQYSYTNSWTWISTSKSLLFKLPQIIWHTHQCQDCFGCNLWCSPCCVSAYKTVPLHHVHMWNGKFFEQSDWLTHKLSLNLSHHPGDCS